MTTLDNFNMSPKWQAFSRAAAAFVIGISFWPYGYYWGGRLFVVFLGYHPIFETPPMKFVSCITAGVVSSIVCGLILWNKKWFPTLAAVMAAVTVYFKFDQHSNYWVPIDFFAIVLGYAVVPLLVVLLTLRAKN